MIEKNILHYPRLDTVLMIEDSIKSSKNYPTKTMLWKKLPKKIMYQTYKIIIDYLLDSKKILLTKDNKLIWILADSKKSKKLIERSVAINA
ncbi:MAG: hypothetical protein V1824_04675 [archaeon]